MTDVFVSYASEDRERVKPLVEALEVSGWNVWWDRQIGAGSAFDREIEKAIDEAKCIVVVWSSYSVESEWVRTEANEGLERGNLVPVAIEAVRPPLAFRRIQTIDMTADGAIAEVRESVARFAPPAAQVDGDVSPFVGRTVEREQAQRLLDSIDESTGKALLIGGEVGVGKTRLVRELATAARQRGFVVLTGQCIEMDGAPPYQPLLEQIAQAVRISRPERLRQSLGESAPEVAKLMPELRQQFDDIPDAPTLPPEQERRYLLNGIGDFIDRGARVQPMMLIFEDLHWADDSVCILLRHLAQRLKETPVLLVGTYRDDELDMRRPFANTLRELTRERLVDEIFLKCLDRDGVREIIEGRARRTAPAELIDLVFSETEGNPFFVEEVYRHLEQAGKLFDADGEFLTGVEIADTEVPRGVQLVIGERLGRVSDACQSVLTAAAVVGRTFSYDLLLRIDRKLDEDDVLDAVEEATGAGLIEDLSSRREARYGFAHEQIRQALLMGLSMPRRQRMHLRIAEGLQEFLGDRAEEHAAELGYHLYQAGASADLDLTMHYLTVAGRRALDALAFEDAYRKFDSVLEIAEDDDERLRDIHCLQAAALVGSGRIDDALEAYDKALDLADDAQRDEIILQRCKMLLDVWRGSEAVDDMEQLLERRKSAGDREGELDALQWLARAYYVKSLDEHGWTEKARDAYHDTIDLARELGNDKILGHTLIATSQLTDYDGSYRTVVMKNVAEAEEIGQRLGDEEIEIDAATARLATGVLSSENPVDMGERVLTRLLERRDPIRLNAHYFRMMWSTLSGARLDRCLEICDAGIELAYRIGTLPVQYPTIKAMALLALGRFDEALASLEEEIADEAHRFGAALRELGRLQYLCDCAAFDEAAELAPHVIAEAHHLSRVWMLRWIANLLGRVAQYLGDDQALLGLFQELIDETGIKNDRWAEASFALAQGDAASAAQLASRIDVREGFIPGVRQDLDQVELAASAWMAAGEWQRAREMIDPALDTAREGGLRQTQWHLLALQSRAASELGDEGVAARSLDEARSIHHEIAGTIADERHREAFLQGRVAAALGVLATA